MFTARNPDVKSMIPRDPIGRVGRIDNWSAPWPRSSHILKCGAPDSAGAEPHLSLLAPEVELGADRASQNLLLTELLLDSRSDGYAKVTCPKKAYTDLVTGRVTARVTHDPHHSALCDATSPPPARATGDVAAAQSAGNQDVGVLGGPPLTPSQL